MTEVALLKLDFQHDFQRKCMLQVFASGSVMNSKQQVTEWKQLWMKELASWHTPYKAMIDCQHLTLGTDQDLQLALAEMVEFLKKLFLRKVAGFNYRPAQNHDLLPFPMFDELSEAEAELAIRHNKRTVGGDLRSQVIIHNHFRQQVVELTFSEQFIVDSVDKLAVIKSKMTNNLMQWHSKWSLLIDCEHLSIVDKKGFEQIIDFFKRYFLQKVVGYNRRGNSEDYPFPAYRSKHKAALQLEGDTDVAGDEAHCRSQRSSTIG